MIKALSWLASWTVPVNVLIRVAGKDYDTQQFRRSWLPPEVAYHVSNMKCDGFTPAETVRLGHRLALVDLEIRWDSDGSDDVILGIWPILRHSVNQLFTSAAYDFSLCFRMIGDDHPHLRKLCYPIAQRLSKIGL